jgi:hypothetical protein
MGAFGIEVIGPRGWWGYIFTTPPPRYKFMNYQGQQQGILGFGALEVTVNIDEGAGTIRLTIYRTAGPFSNSAHFLFGGVVTGYLKLDWATHDGTAIAGTDYVPASGSLQWNDGDITPKGIQIQIYRRVGSTTNVNFTVKLTPSLWTPPGGLVAAPIEETISPDTATITIIRNAFGELDFTGPAWQVVDPNSGSSVLTLQVQRFNGIKGAGGCSFHTTDGSAIAGTDYTATSGTLSWADGDNAPKSISVTILGRSGSQGNRSFTVTIDTPTGTVVIGATNVGTVTIVESGPNPNPTPGGTPPQQLDGNVDDQGAMMFGAIMIDPVVIGLRNRNITYGGVLGNKIGSVIGFGNDFDNTDFSLSPTPKNARKIRRQDYAERT